MKKALNFTFLYKKYPGQWVALADDEKTVLGVGKTAKQALTASKKSGSVHPILHRIPGEISLSISLVRL